MNWSTDATLPLNTRMEMSMVPCPSTAASSGSDSGVILRRSFGDNPSNAWNAAGVCSIGVGVGVVGSSLAAIADRAGTPRHTAIMTHSIFIKTSFSVLFLGSYHSRILAGDRNLMALIGVTWRIFGELYI
jgi:hypothetical protein